MRSLQTASILKATLGEANQLSVLLSSRWSWRDIYLVRVVSGYPRGCFGRCYPLGSNRVVASSEKDIRHAESIWILSRKLYIYVITICRKTRHISTVVDMLSSLTTNHPKWEISSERTRDLWMVLLLAHLALLEWQQWLSFKLILKPQHKNVLYIYHPTKYFLRNTFQLAVGIIKFQDNLEHLNLSQLTPPSIQFIWIDLTFYPAGYIT